MTPAISVLLCTRNRSASLARTLQGMMTLVPPSDVGWELVVVDNGSTDDTPEVITQAARSLPIKHVFEPIGGVSRARNAALAASSGQIIFITDDDCLPASDWLAVGYGLLQPDPLQIVGGRIELYDRDDMPVSLRLGTKPERLTAFTKMGGFCLSANLVCGRVVFDALGGFDVRLGPGTQARSNEDADLVYRAFRAAIPVVYDPALLVLHAHGRDTWAKANRLHRAYATGDGAMAMKYLLRGDLQPVRTLYWNVRSLLASLRQGKGEVAGLWLQARALRGAWHFLRASDRVREERKSSVFVKKKKRTFIF